MKKILFAMLALLAFSAAPAAALTPAPLSVTAFRLGLGTKTATAVSGAITTESLSTAAGATYTLTITDAAILATDLPLASVAFGTSTTGSPAVVTVTPGAGTLVIKIQNIHATAALNGTLKITFASLRL
jgi:hypothetical protein